MSVSLQMNNLSGGEVAPEFWTRTDLNKYNISMRSSHNGYARLDGSWCNRQGFEYMATTKNSGTATNTAIPYTFKFSNAQSYALIFENQSLRFMQNFGSVGQVVSGSVSAYNGATAYATGQMCTSGGATYYCIGATTGNAPPNATYWYALSGTAPTAIVELPTPYLAADLNLLKFAQSGDTLYIAHQNYPPAMLVRTGANAFTYTPIVFGTSVAAPTGLTITNGTGTAAPVLTLTSQGSGSWPTDSAANGQFAVTAVVGGSESPLSNNIYCLPSAVISWTAVPSATQYNLYYQGRDNDGGTSYGWWRGLANVTSPRTLLLTDVNNGLNITSPAINSYAYVITAVDSNGHESLPSNTIYGAQVTGSTGNTLSWTGSTQAASYRIYSQVNGLWGLVSKAVQGQTSYSFPSGTYVNNLALNPDTSQGIPLVSNPFNSTNNYPAIVSLYQGRTWWANTLTFPKTFWASRVGDFTNLYTNTTLTQADAISYTIAEDAINGILGVVPMPIGALMPTGGTIFQMTTVNDGPVSGSTPPQLKGQASNFGMSPYLTPKVIGNRMVYFDNSGMRCRDEHYQIYEYAYGGNEISIYAKHLFSPIAQAQSWAYINYPDSMNWIARSDGNFVSLGYQREQDSAEFISWAHHDTPLGMPQIQGSTQTYGFVQGFCATPNPNGTSNLWATINRNINGQSVTYVEMMGTRYFTSAYDATFLDCWSQYNSPITITGITNANPCQITAPSHGLSNGNFVRIDKVVGMDQLFNTQGTQRVNGVDVTAYFPTSIYYTVANATTNTFTLLDSKLRTAINSTSFNPYVSGGVVYNCKNSFTNISQLANTAVYYSADGDIGQGTVDGSGNLTLPLGQIAGILTVGLPYLCEMWTMAPEYNTPGGTSKDKIRQFKSAFVNVINTREILVGTNPNSKLTRYSYTKPQQWSNPLQLAGFGAVQQSNMITVYPDENVREGTLYIQVPYGCPCTVNQIIGSMEIGVK